jgi:hypothetical protein
MDHGRLVHAVHVTDAELDLIVGAESARPGRSSRAVSPQTI